MSFLPFVIFQNCQIKRASFSPSHFIYVKMMNCWKNEDTKKFQKNAKLEPDGSCCGSRGEEQPEIAPERWQPQPPGGINMIIIVVIIIFIRIISTVIRIRMMNIRVFHKNTFLEIAVAQCWFLVLRPSGVSLKRSRSKMKFISVDLRSIGPPSPDKRPNQFFVLFSH